MSRWNPSSDDDDEVFAGYHRRSDSSPRGSGLPQVPKRMQSPSTAKETLMSPGPPPMFQMGRFASEDADDVFSFKASSTPRPEPEDVSFSLSKPENTRRTIEKMEGSNAYIITRRGDRPHTPFSANTGGKPLDSEVTKVQRVSRGFNLPAGGGGTGVNSGRSRSQSLSQRYGATEGEGVRFLTTSRPPARSPPPPLAAPTTTLKMRGATNSLSSASNSSAAARNAPTRRISTQGKTEIVPATRGRNRSLQSNAANDTPVYNWHDVETTQM